MVGVLALPLGGDLDVVAKVELAVLPDEAAAGAVAVSAGHP